MKMRIRFVPFAVALSLFAGVWSCTNIDCPLDNVVAMTCGLYNAEDGRPASLDDTLTVRAGGVKDTILLNKAQHLSSFQLPVRHGVDEDTLLFRFSDEQGRFAVDSVLVKHLKLRLFPPRHRRAAATASRAGRFPAKKRERKACDSMSYGVFSTNTSNFKVDGI